MVSVALSDSPYFACVHSLVDRVNGANRFYGCIVAAHQFLSAAWIDAALEIHDEFADRVTPPDQPVRMNVTVTDAPLNDGEILGYLDTTEGSFVPLLGHLDNPDLSVRVPYNVAREMLVEQQYDQLMIAFMSGEIEVEGDITLMLELQDLDPSPEERDLAEAVATRLRDITE